MTPDPSLRRGADALRRWGDRQIRALIDAGIDPFDAELAVTWMLDNVPPGSDPNTWIPSADLLAQPDLPFAGVIQDARTAWFASDAVPRAFKRILEAHPDRG